MSRSAPIFFDQIKPKKHLGQVFLKDETVIRKIVSSCNIQKTDTVLEIGPGPGALTGFLAERAKKVIAVETDKRFCEKLEKDFQGKNVEIIHADFLKCDLGKFPRNLIAVGNLPYYISSPIIGKILEGRAQFTSAFFTVQLEFANRLIAKISTRDYSSLTCFAQYYADVKKMFKISRGSFRPIPKVDSAFVHLQLYKSPPLKAADEKLLFEIIHTAFQQRRKTILNALNILYPKSQIASILATLDINPQLRPENLRLEDFINISNAFPTHADKT